MEDYSPDSGTENANEEVPLKIKNKELEFELDDTDIALLARKAAATQKEISDLEAQFQSLKDDWKARISSKEADVRDALKAISSGKQVKKVDCILRKDFNLFTVSFVYNGKVIESRPMTHEERQPDLPHTTKQEDQPLTENLGEKMTQAEADQNRSDIASAFRG